MMAESVAGQPRTKIPKYTISQACPKPPPHLSVGNLCRAHPIGHGVTSIQDQACTQESRASEPGQGRQEEEGLGEADVQDSLMATPKHPEECESPGKLEGGR